MRKNKKGTFVISLGGSLLVPENVDVTFISKFTNFVRKKVSQGFQFIIITGGGKLSRQYIDAGSSIAAISPQDQDAIGISVTKVNAELIRSIFGKLAAPDVYMEPSKVSKKYPISIAGGWKPGRSTDDVSVRFAVLNGVKIVINLSNIDKLYTADPKKDKNALPIDSISWKDFQKLVGTKRLPGGNYPFDPVAAQTAKIAKIETIIASADLDNLNNILLNKLYIGTIIS